MPNLSPKFQNIPSLNKNTEHYIQENAKLQPKTFKNYKHQINNFLQLPFMVEAWHHEAKFVKIMLYHTVAQALAPSFLWIKIYNFVQS